MTASPIDLVIVDGVAVSKAALRSYEKDRARIKLGNPTEVRNTKLSGQFGGIYVRSLQNNFDLDAGDTTTPDDGVNCIIDLDGNRFKKVPIDTSTTQRLVVASGAVTVSADDADIVVIDKTVAAATTVNLPPAADRTKAVKIVDGKGDANTNNITIVPQSGEKVFGTVDYTPIIDGNGGQITLTPRADGTGWF
ncbi:hypothetical protein RPMA_12500 [Tardiphaga alba]|uniref:Uncharacterized protein n=1 Tax=Tardiphaga alba TaxID=340268 RepID=A0ABX8AAZ2_9BRAD|nr:hypothetical protein [Tardiphaga alba]QUS39565.1 hypothetical protein RPMA_12500 [Tardiphaga alba]